MKAACRHFRKCSGCTKLQFPYAKQLRDKDLVVRDALARAAGGADSPVFEPLTPSPLPLGYRTSTKLSLSVDPFGRRSIGLYERGTKTVVDIPDCPVHHPAINRLVARLFGGDRPLPAPLYNHAKRGFQPGCLKFVTVRVSPATGEAGMVLSHTGVARAALEAWAAGLGERELCLYEAALTAADEDRILSDAVRPLAGPAEFRYAVSGQSFRLTPLAFFQANFSLTDAFVEHVAAGLAGATLLDLYGGFGAYSFVAAPGFEKAYLVDGSASAIAAAAATNQDRRLAGLTPVHASVEDFLGRRLSPRDAASVTHVIVNPPRSGLSPTAKARLTRAALPALAGMTYVSCNPQTLARDLGELTGACAMRLRSIRAFDMFPQTDHIEVVATLDRPGTRARR